MSTEMRLSPVAFCKICRRPEISDSMSPYDRLGPGVCRRAAFPQSAEHNAECCDVANRAIARVAEQVAPAPERAGLPAVWDLVVADMRERDREGRRKYGTPLQPRNGRDALVDASQEALDLVVYLRQAIWERDGK